MKTMSLIIFLLTLAACGDPTQAERFAQMEKRIKCDHEIFIKGPGQGIDFYSGTFEKACRHYVDSNGDPQIEEWRGLYRSQFDFTCGFWAAGGNLSTDWNHELVLDPAVHARCF